LGVTIGRYLYKYFHLISFYLKNNILNENINNKSYFLTKRDRTGYIT
jgi:hypothetical protein